MSKSAGQARLPDLELSKRAQGIPLEGLSMPKSRLDSNQLGVGKAGLSPLGLARQSGKTI
jgi:hypothetical protein